MHNFEVEGLKPPTTPMWTTEVSSYVVLPLKKMHSVWRNVKICL